MRKLQFAGERCVLDVFLYPLREGQEPVATYVEARRASIALGFQTAQIDPLVEKTELPAT